MAVPVMKKTGKSKEANHKNNKGKQQVVIEAAAANSSSSLLMVNINNNDKKGKQVQVFADHNQLPESSSSSSAPQFPPGFRFSPTEPELIVHYLHKKVLGIPITYDPNPVAERDLYGNEEPEQICRSLGKAQHEDFYVFTLLRSKSGGGSHMARRAGNGTWKGDHRAKPVYDENDMTTLIGCRTTLTFFHNMTKRTSWIMHQYTLPHQQQGWSLCRIHNEAEAKKKRKFSAVVTYAPQHPLPPSSPQPIIHESPVPAAKRPRTNDQIPSSSSQPNQTPLQSTGFDTGFLSFLLNDVDYYHDMDPLLDSSHTTSFQNAYGNFASLLSPTPASNITLSELSTTDFASASLSHPQQDLPSSSQPQGPTPLACDNSDSWA